MKSNIYNQIQQLLTPSHSPELGFIPESDVERVLQTLRIESAEARAFTDNLLEKINTRTIGEVFDHNSYPGVDFQAFLAYLF